MICGAYLFCLCIHIIATTTNQVLNITSTHIQTINATIGCSFNQSFYCVVCCSTDPSVPPDSSVYNVSSTRGTEVTVYLGDLTSGQMYYCKASATNTTSANCGGPVVGGVKVFFSFITPPQPSSSPPPSSPLSTSGVYTMPCASPIPSLFLFLSLPPPSHLPQPNPQIASLEVFLVPPLALCSCVSSS